MKPSSPREPRPWRTFFCSFALPRAPGHSGGEIRDFHLLEHLLEIGSVEFFALREDEPHGRADLLGPRLEGLHAPARMSPLAAGALRRLVRALTLRKVPILGPRYHWDVARDLPEFFASMAPALDAALRAKAPDFLFVSPQINPVALALDTSTLPTRAVLASYDVEAHRIRSLAQSERGIAKAAQSLEAARAERFERENLRRFDGIIAVSRLDQSAYVSDYGFAPERVLVLDNGVDTGHFAFTERSAASSPEIVFVGNLGYVPNQQAARRLIDRILPRLHQRFPGARLWIVGSNARHAGLSVSQTEHLVVTGAVADVRPYLDRASLACVPLESGAGTKYKVLEALSAGVPLVATPVALEGLELQAGEHALVGATDRELVSAMTRLLEEPDLAVDLARRGRRLVESRYSWRGILPRLDPWLSLVAELPRRGAPNA